MKPAVIIVTDNSSSSGDSSFMACVIAQRRVHPVVLHGNPLTEHNVLLVRPCERVDQQVPSFTGWKWRPQPRRSEGIPLALRAHHLRDALTCVTCWRPSPTTGKVGLLTSSRTSFFRVFRVFGLEPSLFSAPRILETFDVFLCAFLVRFGRRARDAKVCSRRKL